MPTISEDSISQRSSQFGDEANFEQLMVSMLDERDKLVESLKNEQEKTSEFEVRVKELEKERDSLSRQLNQNLPQVRPKTNQKIQKFFSSNCVGYYLVYFRHIAIWRKKFNLWIFTIFLKNQEDMKYK